MAERQEGTEAIRPSKKCRTGSGTTEKEIDGEQNGSEPQGKLNQPYSAGEARHGLEIEDVFDRKEQEENERINGGSFKEGMDREVYDRSHPNEKGVDKYNDTLGCSSGGVFECSSSLLSKKLAFNQPRGFQPPPVHSLSCSDIRLSGKPQMGRGNNLLGAKKDLEVVFIEDSSDDDFGRGTSKPRMAKTPSSTVDERFEDAEEDSEPFFGNHSEREKSCAPMYVDTYKGEVPNGQESAHITEGRPKPPRVSADASFIGDQITAPSSEKPKKEKKKRKRKKKNRDSLFSKKEENSAKLTLSNVGDLSQFLPQADAELLGSLWIFTTQQLNYVLGKVHGNQAQECKIESDGQARLQIASLQDGHVKDRFLHELIKSPLLEACLDSSQCQNKDGNSLKCTDENGADSGDKSRYFSAVDDTENHQQKILDNVDSSGSVYPNKDEFHASLDGDWNPPKDPSENGMGASTTQSSNINTNRIIAGVTDVEDKPATESDNAGSNVIVKSLATSDMSRTSEELLPETASHSSSIDKGRRIRTKAGEKPETEAESASIKFVESRSRSWADAIEKWNKSRRDKTATEEQKTDTITTVGKTFPLSGPLKKLFPPFLILFFRSMGITTAFEFLSARKTESSKLIDSFSRWCGNSCTSQSKEKKGAIARYILGLSHRLETALTSVPPANERTRKWMGSMLIVLTGSARDFVIQHCQAASAEEFLETKTKHLATELVMWREGKGLKALQGSGNVATISGWKTCVKDAVEAENRLEESIKVKMGAEQCDVEVDENNCTPAPVLSITASDGELHKGICAPDSGVVGSSSSMDHVTPCKEIIKTVKRNDSCTSKSIETIESPLTNPIFLGRVLRPSSIALLSEIGITNAAELIAAPKRASSPAVLAMIEYRAKCGQPLIQTSSCVRALYEWTQKVKDRLDRVGGMEGEGRSLFKKRGRPRGGTNKAKGEREKGQKMEEEEAVHDDENSETEGDPIYSLSKFTRSFLASQGITKGEHLLSTKSSIVSEAFIRWRAERNMSVLKGFGAIASVSSWKATVRDAAVELGMEGLLGMVPVGKTGKKGAVSSPRPEHVGSSAKNGESTENSHPLLLSGLRIRPFSVCNATRDIIYDFELSIRNLEHAHPLDSFEDVSFYLTFKGSRVLHAKLRDRKLATKLNGKSLGLPILSDLPLNANLDWISPDNFSRVDSIPFCTLGADCGLIDLSRYGVPTPSVCDKINCELERFISGEKCIPLLMLGGSADSIGAVSEEGKDTISLPQGQDFADVKTDRQPASGRHANVFVTTNKESRQNLFYISEPMEKGQSVELSAIPLPTSNTNSNTAHQISTNIFERTQLEQAIFAFSMDQIESVLVFLNSTYKSSICSKVDDFINGLNRGVDSEEEADADAETCAPGGLSPPSASKLFLSRRRLHWIAKRLLVQANVLSNIAPGLDCNWVEEQIGTFLWGSRLCDESDLFLDWCDGVLFEALQQEVSEEILTALSGKDLLVDAFDGSKWCQLSMDLLRSLLDQFSAYELMNVEGTLESQRDLVKSIVQCASKATKTLINASQLDKNSVQKLAFKCAPSAAFESAQNEATNFLSASVLSTAPKHVVAQISDLQAYQDAMELCDEIKCGLECNALLLPTQNMTDNSSSTFMTELPWNVATGSPSSNKSQEECIAVARHSKTILAGSALLHKQWYFANQIMGVVDALASSGIVGRWKKIRQSFGLKPVAVYSFTNALKSVIGSISDDGGLQVNHLAYRHGPFVRFFRDTLPRESCVEPAEHHKRMEHGPKSLPIFFKLVWPKLQKKYGWRLEAGRSSSDISFLPPGETGHKRKMVAVELKRERKDRAQKRSKVAEQVAQTGVLYFPRSLKQLFVNSVDYASRMTHSKAEGQQTVKEVLDKYLECVLGEQELRERRENVQKIVNGVLSYFDTMLPLVLPESIRKKPGSQRNCELYGCEHLLRLFIILPCVLTGMGVKTDEVENMTAVVRDITHFITVTHAECLDGIHLPQEDFKEERMQFSSDLIDAFASMKRNSPSSGVSTDPEVASGGNLDDQDRSAFQSSQDLVRSEDKHLLTDYTYLIMSQILPYRAAPSDTEIGKRKHLRVGYPGIVCKHCFTYTNIGNRYFFATVESLATSSAVLNGHMQKCTHCPDDIKRSIRKCKARHNEQRKTLPFGSQMVFYTRVWNRLFSYETESVSSHNSDTSVCTPLSCTEQTNSGDDTDQPIVNADLFFHSHVDLMAYLGRTEPWSQTLDLMNSFDEYYSCLSLGGKLWNTEAMPVQFSSERFLRERQPKRRRMK